MRGVTPMVMLAGCSFTPGAAPGGVPGADAADPGIADAMGGRQDAATPTADVGSDALALGPWGPPTVVFGGTAIDDPTMTADRLELYANYNGNIYGASRNTTNTPWTVLSLDSALSSPANETTPEITGDGLTIFLASSRTGTAGSDDLWVSTRPDRNAVWATPVRVAELSSTATDAASAPTDDGLAIVFISDRAGGLGAADIYESTRSQVGAAWGAPVNLLAPVNTSGSDFSPMLSQDRLTLYFDSARDGSSDLFVATRASVNEPFGTPTPISELNTSGQEVDPWVSPDQRYIVFARDGSIYAASR